MKSHLCHTIRKTSCHLWKRIGRANPVLLTSCSKNHLDPLSSLPAFSTSNAISNRFLPADVICACQTRLLLSHFASDISVMNNSWSIASFKSQCSLWSCLKVTKKFVCHPRMMSCIQCVCSLEKLIEMLTLCQESLSQIDDWVFQVRRCFVAMHRCFNLSHLSRKPRLNMKQNSEIRLTGQLATKSFTERPYYTMLAS